MTLKIKVAVATHRGKVRAHNQDTAGIGGWTLRAMEPVMLTMQLDVDDAAELVVADGLGGHAGGEEASTAAVTAFFAAQGTLVERIASADAAVHNLGERTPRLSGLATTLAGVQLRQDGQLTIFHLGDSRVYRYIDGLLGLLTDDDKYPDGSLTQVLGGSLRMQLDAHLYETYLAGDTLLICSDGLTAVLDEEEIAVVLQLPLDEAAARLMDLALDSGAPDNVTLILCAAV